MKYFINRWNNNNEQAEQWFLNCTDLDEAINEAVELKQNHLNDKVKLFEFKRSNYTFSIKEILEVKLSEEQLHSTYKGHVIAI